MGAYLLQLYPEQLYFEPSAEHGFDGLELFVPPLEVIGEGEGGHRTFKALQGHLLCRGKSSK